MSGHIEIHIPHLRSGKVRDIYDLSSNLLLFITSDRISAFDVVLPNTIPGKGGILSRMSAMWMKMFEPLIPNHLVNTDLQQWMREQFPENGDGIQVVRKLIPLPFESIVRGYITGSAWKEYKEMVGEIQKGDYSLPLNLIEHQQLETPLFTPSTKAEKGHHDEAMTRQELADLIGVDLADRVERKSLSLYKLGAQYALKRGIIIADTKFEFAYDEISDKLYLIDEVLTPDSSRFWPVSEYVAGQTPPSFDKQFVRNYLLEYGWDKKSPPPVLPPEVVLQTQEKYKEAERRLMASADET